MPLYCLAGKWRNHQLQHTFLSPPPSTPPSLNRYRQLVVESEHRRPIPLPPVAGTITLERASIPECETGVVPFACLMIDPMARPAFAGVVSSARVRVLGMWVGWCKRRWKHYGSGSSGKKSAACGGRWEHLSWCKVFLFVAILNKRFSSLNLLRS